MRCRTNGCPEVVEYHPQPVNGLFARDYVPPEGRRRIYLTCDQGHTHPYAVWPAHQIPKR